MVVGQKIALGRIHAREMVSIRVAPRRSPSRSGQTTSAPSAGPPTSQSATCKPSGPARPPMFPRPPGKHVLGQNRQSSGGTRQSQVQRVLRRLTRDNGPPTDLRYPSATRGRNARFGGQFPPLLGRFRGAGSAQVHCYRCSRPTACRTGGPCRCQPREDRHLGGRGSSKYSAAGCPAASAVPVPPHNLHTVSTRFSSGHCG